MNLRLELVAVPVSDVDPSADEAKLCRGGTALGRVVGSGRVQTARMATPANGSGMRMREVFAVLDSLKAAGCRFWLEGGWGVDALGATRPDRTETSMSTSTPSAKKLAWWPWLSWATSLRPTGGRTESSWPHLVAAGWMCTHYFSRRMARLARRPLMVAFRFSGRVLHLGLARRGLVPCVTAAAQHLFHSGYEVRAADIHDLGQLDKLEPHDSSLRFRLRRSVSRLSAGRGSCHKWTVVRDARSSRPSSGHLGCVASGTACGLRWRRWG